MAGRGKLAVTAIKMGVKYGPQVWVATQALREPAKEAIGKAVSSEKARREAMAHARSLADGSILKVYQGDRSHWVVLTGEDAVAVYPPTDLPLEILTERADRTKRIRPDEKVKPTDRAKDAATAALRRGKPHQVD
ncbi:MAG: hypothetical protein JWP82_140 [Humibacillus sp.]|nr:hypothetical protein [Humibacillus sp.]